MGSNMKVFRPIRTYVSAYNISVTKHHTAHTASTAVLVDANGG